MDNNSVTLRKLNHKAKTQLNDLNRRAGEVYGQPDKLTLEDIKAVRTFYDFTCLNCKTKPATSIDHVISLAHGGTNKRSNLQLLCESCNKAKGDSDTDYRNSVILSDDYAIPGLKPKNELIVLDNKIPLKSKYKARGKVTPQFHGKAGRSGRHSKSQEEMMLQAFKQALPPMEFGRMTTQLVEMFYNGATVQDTDGNTLRLVVDASTRARIWEKLAAYAIGEPVRRAEVGRIGELQQYLEELVTDEEVGDAAASGEDIQASWVQTAAPK